MISISTLINFSVVFLLGFFVQGDKTKQTEKLISAQTIIDKHIESRGGRAKLAKVKTLVKKGTIEYVTRDDKGTTVSYFDGGKVYSKLDFEGYGTNEMGFDGKVAWRCFQGKRFSLVKPEELQNHLAHKKHVMKTLDFTMAFNGSFETTAREMVNGKPAYKIVFEPRDGVKFANYYDAKTWRVVKNEHEQRHPTSTLKVELTYTDFKKFGDFEFATSKKTFSNGVHVYNIKVDSYEINKPIDPKIFELPDEIKELVKAKERDVPPTQLRK